MSQELMTIHGVNLINSFYDDENTTTLQQCENEDRENCCRDGLGGRGMK